MTDLDTMRPEVLAALEVFDGEAACTCHPAYTSRGMKDPQCNHDLKEYVDVIRAELLRLADENERMRGIIETLDVEGHKRAERAEAELAALKARIAEAPEVTVCRHPAGAVMMLVPEGLSGKRVRLLVDEPPAERGEG